MRVKEIERSYFDWLKKKITFKKVNDIIEINTPFMDRHNDHLQIYVENLGAHRMRLTDDAHIISDLELSGCDIDSSPRRREVFNTILNGFGVLRSTSDELTVEATYDNFPQKKHMLIQAMISVNDMFITSKTNIYSIFLEDVEQYLFENDIRFTENIKFTGKSGMDHKFDFVIPRSKKRPERIIQTVNNPTRDKVESVLFAWNDTKDIRRSSSTLYTFINDLDKSVNHEMIQAFQQYEVKPVLWSNRKNIIKELIA